MGKEIKIFDYQNQLKNLKFTIDGFLDNDEVPKELKGDYILLRIGCLRKQYPILFEKNSVNKIVIYLGLSKTTVNNFLRNLLKKHHELWDYLNNSDFCEDINFRKLILRKLNSITLESIQSNDYYNDYYKYFLQENLIERKDYSKRKTKLGKIRFKKYAKDSYRRKKINEFNKALELFKSSGVQKKIHILANSKSSDTIKKLAKNYDCKIYDLSKTYSKNKSSWFYNLDLENLENSK